MPYPLIGLESVVSDERCDAVRLSRPDGGAEVVYLRQDGEGWTTADQGSDPIHTEQLLAAIGEAFGREYDTLECFVADEKVEYVLGRGAVVTRRVPRKKAERFGEPAAESRTLAEVLGIPGSKRRPKFRQAYQFAVLVLAALPPDNGVPLRVLDCACGRSYLGFVLLDLLSARGRSATLHGVDSDGVLVEKCREIAGDLGWTNCTFETADLATYGPAGTWDAVVSLHGCDTLTDDAIRIGCKAGVPLICVAPCCQHELRHGWKTHPLGWTKRYGLVEQRLADALTDGFRCLVLEALGYRVQVLRFTSQEVTPKNLLIRARLAGGHRPGRLAEARAFLKQFNARPRLAGLLDSVAE